VAAFIYATFIAEKDAQARCMCMFCIKYADAMVMRSPQLLQHWLLQRLVALSGAVVVFRVNAVSGQQLSGCRRSRNRSDSAILSQYAYPPHAYILEQF
jgi:hypothetical protein